MDDPTPEANHLINEAQCLAAFTGITVPQPQDRFLLVMGRTGSGKSTFIGRCTGADVVVGHGLYSCTKSVNVVDCVRDGRRIFLVDTPGFNDTDRTDTEVLRILATYLGASYANGVRIHGIIMLYPISDNRMSGSSLRNIEMMKAVCGFASYQNLAILTTMWPDRLDDQELHALEQREAELFVDDKYFGALVGLGASVFRYDGVDCTDPVPETTSAVRIVDHLMSRAESHNPEVLQLQHEMVDQSKILEETTAGIVVAGELYQESQAHQHQLWQLERELKTQLAERDASHKAQLLELKVDLESKLRKAQQGKQTLLQTMQQMHEEEATALKQTINHLEEQFRVQLETKEQELRDMEDSLHEIRKDIVRKARKEHEEKQVVLQTQEHEKMVIKARKDVEKARKSHSAVGNVLGGTASGLASGLTTGIVTAAIAGGLFCTVM